MTHSRWNAIGYFQSSPSDLLVLPIFSREIEPAVCFAQFTFSSASSYFELIPVEVVDFCHFVEPLPVTPDKFLYVGLKIGNKVEVAEKSKSFQYISNIKYSDLTDSAKIQYIDLVGNSDIQEKTPISVDRDDFAFFATLSAQGFVDRAFASAKAEADTAAVAREIARCSRWVTDWTLERIPPKRLSALLANLTIARDELELALNEHKAEAVDRYGVNVPETGSNFVIGIVKSIAALRRQELRVSQILRAIVLDEDRGKAIIKNYRPKTKYEELVIPMIVNMVGKINHSDQREREFEIGKIIPKIYVKYFPVRRGRFIVDFLRVLGDFPIIRDQIISIYRQKMNTYGVHLYEDVIQQLIHGDDDTAFRLRQLLT